jgi:hypothetical protein
MKIIFATIGIIVPFALSVVWYSMEHDVSDTGSVSIFRLRVGRTLLCWGPLEGANLYHRTMEKVQTRAVIHSVRHHCQNPLESTGISLVSKYHADKIWNNLVGLKNITGNVDNINPSIHL